MKNKSAKLLFSICIAACLLVTAAAQAAPVSQEAKEAVQAFNLEMGRALEQMSTDDVQIAGNGFIASGTFIFSAMYAMNAMEFHDEYTNADLVRLQMSDPMMKGTINGMCGTISGFKTLIPNEVKRTALKFTYIDVNGRSFKIDHDCK
ncbi:hypothetical protein [Agarivorans sp. JK6]|uniref:hypothetical protein n=1 Tax=Agarivorans sp. JK6 TaxID=2997426 RepID=UPI003872AB50